MKSSIDVIRRTGKPDIVDCEACRYHMRSRDGVVLAAKHADIMHTSQDPIIAVYNDDTYEYDRSRHDRHYKRTRTGPDSPAKGD